VSRHCSAPGASRPVKAQYLHCLTIPPSPATCLSDEVQVRRGRPTTVGARGLAYLAAAGRQALHGPLPRPLQMNVMLRARRRVQYATR
jgi:hypothetical protein